MKRCPLCQVLIPNPKKPPRDSCFNCGLRKEYWSEIFFLREFHEKITEIHQKLLVDLEQSGNEVF